MGPGHPGLLLKSPEDSEKLVPCPLVGQGGSRMEAGGPGSASEMGGRLARGSAVTLALSLPLLSLLRVLTYTVTSLGQGLQSPFEE